MGRFAKRETTGIHGLLRLLPAFLVADTSRGAIVGENPRKS
jgi:hypothetical protein